MSNNDNNRGARLVRTVVEQVGWPVAGEVVKELGRPTRMAILLGTETLWANDANWLRELATVSLAGAHALEAEERGAPLAEPVEEVPEAAPEPTEPVEEPLPAGVDPIGVLCPQGCGWLVHQGPNGLVHLVEGGTAAACPPVDDQETGVFPRLPAEASL